MNVFFEFSKVAAELSKREIRYALVGGVAVAFHVEPRHTKDIDLLISAAELQEVTVALHASGYVERAEPWIFSDSQMKLHHFTRFEGEEMMFVDVLIGMNPRHVEIIENAITTLMGDIPVRVASKNDLIWMKEFRNSKSDQADIEKLKDD